jgi:hypothetical protein
MEIKLTSHRLFPITWESTSEDLWREGAVNVSEACVPVELEKIIPLPHSIQDLAQCFNAT